LSQVSDNAHVITSCDLTWDTNWASSYSRLAFHRREYRHRQGSGAPGRNYHCRCLGTGQDFPARANRWSLTARSCGQLDSGKLLRYGTAPW